MDARLVVCLTLFMLINVCSGKGYRKPVIRYPKNTLFWATDFFVKGCKTFVDNCPSAYKTQQICARSYDDEYKNFANYCFMQYENCNSWRNWRVFKREQC